MNLQIEGQTAVVFGAAKGIGRAIAKGFLEEGCQVFGFDIDPLPEPLQTVGDLVSGDVTDLDQIKSFADQLQEVDHVIYSVGAGSGKVGFPFWNVPPAAWARVLDINLIGAVNVAHVFAPKLIARGAGSFLFLTSVAGQVGSQTDPPYSAAKAGLINFMQCAAKDLAPFLVRANALAPGMVQTELNQSVWAASQQRLPEAQRQTYEAWANEKIRKVSPLGRWQQPEEYAAMATYLASPHARNITGQTLNIDGGQVMHS